MFFLFFKQKTSYALRISDWSSDVCSSDLVTPALHTPLMSVTNAISSVIVVGALIAAGASPEFNASKIFGLLAIVLVSVNIFGGFLVTQRMLAMYKKKEKK